MFGNYPQLIIQVVAQSLIFYLLTLISGIYVSVLLYLGILIVIKVINNHLNEKQSSEISGSKAQEFADSITQEHNLANVELEKTPASSGILLPKLFRKDAILVPEETNPSQLTEDAKVVISHEIAHIHYRDATRSLLIATFYVLLVNTIFYFYPDLSYLVFCGCLLLTYPLVFNYFSHRQEFRADRFAGRMVSVESVIGRLSKNSHLSHGGSIIYTHPSIPDRIDKVYSSDLD